MEKRPGIGDGPKNPVLVLSVHNCEIHGCHLDGYGKDEKALLNRLSEIESFFVSTVKRRIWFNMDGNKISNETLERVAKSVAGLKDKIVKIAFIGLGSKRRAFEKCLTNNLEGTIVIRHYFDDAELAKEWLI